MTVLSLSSRAKKKLADMADEGVGKMIFLPKKKKPPDGCAPRTQSRHRKRRHRKGHRHEVTVRRQRRLCERATTVETTVTVTDSDAKVTGSSESDGMVR